MPRRRAAFARPSAGVVALTRPSAGAPALLARPSAGAPARLARAAFARPSAGVVALLALLAGAACGDDADDEPPPAVAWAACEGPFQTMERCGTLPVPLDWDEPRGKKITVFVAKTRAVGQARGQLWFLQGGPGASGAVFAERPEGGAPSLVDAYHQSFPDLDLYVLEHRGVGRSTRLGCPAYEADRTEAGFFLSEGELPKCVEAIEAEWGEGLRHFNARAAARDLAAATDATRAAGQQLFVYSVSYGTYWAIQYLRERPADAAGVVLDSVAAPGVQFFDDFGLQTDVVARKLAALCAADALCAGKMGPDPWARLAELMARVRQGGGCFDAVKAEADRRAREDDPGAPSPFPDGATYAAVVERFLRISLQFRELNGLVFPLAYRLARCEPADAAAFYDYALEVSRRLARGDEDPAARLDSDMLRLHVGASELYNPAAPPRAAIEAACDEALFCSLPLDVVYHDAWPRYPLPPDAWSWPATGVPILALGGELDPQTPIEKAQSIEPYLRAPAQNFVRVPFATHTVLLNSPVKTPGLATCGGQMVDAFLRDPSAPPATGCLGDLEPPSFTRPAAFAEGYFKQGDVWENDPAPPAALAALAAPAAGASPARRLEPPARRPERLGRLGR